MVRIRLFSVLIFLLNAFSLSAQEQEQFCAQLKDGIIVVFAGEQEIDREIKLSTGTIIKPDGNVLKKDGTSLVLEDKDCVDANGDKIKVFPKNFNDKEDKKPLSGG